MRERDPHGLTEERWLARTSQFTTTYQGSLIMGLYILGKRRLEMTALGSMRYLRLLYVEDVGVGRTSTITESLLPHRLLAENRQP